MAAERGVEGRGSEGGAVGGEGEGVRERGGTPWASYGFLLPLGKGDRKGVGRGCLAEGVLFYIGNDS